MQKTNLTNSDIVTFHQFLGEIDVPCKKTNETILRVLNTIMSDYGHRFNFINITLIANKLNLDGALPMDDLIRAFDSTQDKMDKIWWALKPKLKRYFHAVLLKEAKGIKNGKNFRRNDLIALGDLSPSAIEVLLKYDINNYHDLKWLMLQYGNNEDVIMHKVAYDQLYLLEDLIKMEYIF